MGIGLNTKGVKMNIFINKVSPEETLTYLKGIASEFGDKLTHKTLISKVEEIDNNIKPIKKSNKKSWVECMCDVIREDYGEREIADYFWSLPRSKTSKSKTVSILGSVIWMDSPGNTTTWEHLSSSSSLQKLTDGRFNAGKSVESGIVSYIKDYKSAIVALDDLIDEIEMEIESSSSSDVPGSNGELHPDVQGGFQIDDYIPEMFNAAWLRQHARRDASLQQTRPMPTINPVPTMRVGSRDSTDTFRWVTDEPLPSINLTENEDE